MINTKSARNECRESEQMPSRPDGDGLTAIDEERLALWGRWEQMSFGLYKLQVLKREEPSVDAHLLKSRLLDDLLAIERQLGLPPCPHAPFTQGHLY